MPLQAASEQPTHRGMLQQTLRFKASQPGFADRLADLFTDQDLYSLLVKLEGTALTAPEAEAASAQRGLPSTAYQACICLLSWLPAQSAADRAAFLQQWCLGMMQDSQASHMEMPLGSSVVRLTRTGAGSKVHEHA